MNENSKSQDQLIKNTKREPWRLDDFSLKEGKNLHIKIARGLYSDIFLDWVKEEAGRYGISEDQFMAGIIETIRKIEWEDIKVMDAMGIATKKQLPFLMIADEPIGNILALNKAWDKSRLSKDTSAVFSKDQAEADLGDRAMKIIKEQRLKQIKALMGEETENIALGAYLNGVIGLQTHLVISFFLPDKDDSGESRKKYILRAIAEEELHYQDYKTEEYFKEMGDFDLQRKDKTGQKAEAAVGIKEMAAIITEKLPSLDILLEPFYQRVRKKER